MDKESAIKAGGKLWEKGNHERVYFDDRAQIATVLNCALVERMSGMIPRGFNGMLKKGKTKSYYDVKNSTLFTDCADVAKEARGQEIRVVRLPRQPGYR